MTITDDQLYEAALAARDKAYAPYSCYCVGCAIAAGGAIYPGANIENASFSVTVCAERVAIGVMVMGGHTKIDAICVVTQSTPPVGPCGVCLQAMAELSGDARAVRVIMANVQGEREVATLAELLPRRFRKQDLDEAT